MDGSDYRGTVHTTVFGRTCLNWTDPRTSYDDLVQFYPNSGIGDHNYCRNPGGTGSQPWCFIIIDEGGAVGEDCADIGVPQASCTSGTTTSVP